MGGSFLTNIQVTVCLDLPEAVQRVFPFEKQFYNQYIRSHLSRPSGSTPPSLSLELPALVLINMTPGV